MGESMVDNANPSEEHQMLREMIRDFTQEFVEPQAHEFDKKEKFNLELFRKLGELNHNSIHVLAQPEGWRQPSGQSPGISVVVERCQPCV